MAKSNSQRQKEFRQKHPTRTKEIRERYRNKLKKEVLTHYGNGNLSCVKCGFADIRALTLDHIIATGKLGREKSPFGFYSRLKQGNYPSGYQTLCMNCQFIKRHENNECACPFWRFPPKG